MKSVIRSKQDGRTVEIEDVDKNLVTLRVLGPMGNEITMTAVDRSELKRVARSL